ncbi:MAG: methylated-DNA--[protein]-cysteine S-methyltransferase [Holosporaceae bacterium]|jgi:methylated-DNA-[protein]-cysteine S-methyltransferase|nr:methylated-DNA--[protein]-cysteine S-methyltransferase [Holosporaceae bacterium]
MTSPTALMSAKREFVKISDENKISHYFSRKTIIGDITICARENAVIGLHFGGRYFSEAENAESEIIRKAFAQLDEYLEGSRRDFDIKLAYDGSNFRVSVWDQLRRIPCGETKSYKEIACGAGNPRSCRAVGKACGKNPIPVFIPCHRVVGADGNLTGYAGGINLKKKLLKIEKTTAISPC